MELVVVDVSSPSSPLVMGQWGILPWDALGVAVSGSYAYVAFGGAGLVAVDVTDPHWPDIVGVGWSQGGPTDVALSGGLVYLADGDVGMEIFRECGLGIFSDGFESGDTSAWSVAVP